MKLKYGYIYLPNMPAMPVFDIRDMHWGLYINNFPTIYPCVFRIKSS